MTYNQALAIDQAAGATNGIDLALSQFNVSAIAPRQRARRHGRPT